MKWIAEIKSPRKVSLLIEYDEQAGYYIYAYDENESYDYLQDTFDKAKNFALRKFNVPLAAWQQVE